MNCYSHLDEPREPSGATRGARGRPWRPPDCSAAWTVPTANLRRGEGVNPFPTLVTSDVTRICETVPTPPRAAGDRPRAPRYMVWIGTMDPYPKRPHSRRRPRPPCLRSRPRRCRRRRPVTVRWKSMSRDRNARSDRRHGLCVMQVSHADDAVAEIPRVRYFSRLHVPPSHRR